MLYGVILRRQLGRPVDVPLELEPVQDLILHPNELSPRPHRDGEPLVRVGREVVGGDRALPVVDGLVYQGLLGEGGVLRREERGAEVDGLAQAPQEFAVLAKLK